MATPQEKLEKVFKILDLNGNGAVTLDEITSVFASKGIAADADKLKTDFAALDKDGDGKLKLEEFAGIAQEPYRATYIPYFDKIVA